MVDRCARTAVPYPVADGHGLAGHVAGLIALPGDDRGRQHNAFAAGGEMCGGTCCWVGGSGPVEVGTYPVGPC